MFQWLKKRRTGIAFGGGAVRGFAHIGVVKAFEEHGIQFDCAVGNSAGSIVGALYAQGRSWREMRAIAENISAGNLIGISLRRKGLFSSDKLESFLREMLGDVTFADLRLPFRCVAVNLYDGKLVELSEGSVAKAVRASCSVPGIFAPTPYEDKLLVDGGILNSVPADILPKMGARFRVAVNLNADRGRFLPPHTGVDVLWSAMKIAWNENTLVRLRGVDVVIAPDLTGIGYHDLKQRDVLIELGEQAALQQIERIRMGMRRRIF